MLYILKGYSTQNELKVYTKQQTDWDNLLDMVQNHAQSFYGTDVLERDDFKVYQARYFLSGELKANKRNNDNVISKSLVAFDLEELGDMTDEDLKQNIHKKLKDYAYILYPSINYRDKWQIDKNQNGTKVLGELKSTSIRYRLIINTDRSYSPNEYKPLIRNVEKLIGLENDKGSEKISQPIGLPVYTTHSDRNMLVVNDGEALRVDDFLDQVVEEASSSSSQSQSDGTQDRLPIGKAGRFLTKVATGVEAGGRNVWLTEVTGAILGYRVPSNEAYNLVIEINDSFVNPPLNMSEVNTIFGSILKKEMAKGRNEVTDFD